MTRAGRGGARGSTTAEFALVSTVFFLIFIGLLHVPYTVFGINAVTNGAREAARYGVASANGANACTTGSSGLQAAAAASTQGLAGVTVAAASGTTPFNGSVDAYCEVTVTWVEQPFAGAFGLPAITVSSKSRIYRNDGLS